jgi:hypothetical protein
MDDPNAAIASEKARRYEVLARLSRCEDRIPRPFVAEARLSLSSAFALHDLLRALVGDRRP